MLGAAALADQLRVRIFEFLESDVVSRSYKAQGAYAIGSTRGSVRQRNEDASAILCARYGGEPARDFDIAVVCDGLGGLRAGREAAIVALSSFLTRIIRSKLPAIDRLRGAIEYANSEVFKLLRGAGGTTLSAVLVSRFAPAAVGHVGDSRVYSFSKQSGAVQITTDDTLSAIGKKPGSQEEMRRDNRLLQFVGMGEDLEVHLKTVHPETHSFVLTSDGAHDVPSVIFNRTLRSAKDDCDIVRKLIDLADLLGGEDNATALTIPAKLQSSVEATGADDLNILMLSPYQKFSIWAPRRSESEREVTDPPPPPAARTSLLPDQIKVASAPEPRQGGSKKKPSKKSSGLSERRKDAYKKKNSRKKKITPAASELPLDPVADIKIEFPRRERRR